MKLMSDAYSHNFPRCGFCIAALATFCALGLPAAAATRIVLGDSAATASSSYMTSTSDRAAKWAVNGGGLTGDAHIATNANGTMWMSNTSTTPASQWFKIDLGTVYPLHTLKL